mmetsp:Transcript_4905/g.6857  ORF Transcript_4905/g.6857 Transcript_4905/m.6857 type:complete len:477 (-) Transcript_4905:11-1441(-)
MATTNSVIIKCFIPDGKNNTTISKLLKFEQTNTCDEVFDRIEKTMKQMTIDVPPQSRENYGLYLYLDEANPGNGVWMNGKDALFIYNLSNMKSCVEYKKRVPEPQPEIKNSNTNVAVSSPSSVKRNTITSTAAGIDTSSTVQKKSKIRGFLSRFFENRVDQDELIQRKILLHEAHTEKPVPLRFDVVKRVVEHIEKVGITVEGIYRISALQGDVRQLCRSFEKLDFDLTQVTFPHVACGALKLYFREMIPPLIPFDHYTTFINVHGEPADTKLNYVKQAIWQLPELNRKCLECLIKHLVRVAAHSDQNKMVPTNLAIVIGPAVLRSKVEPDLTTLVAETEKKCSLVTFCIERCSELFDAPPQGLQPAAPATKASAAPQQKPAQTSQQPAKQTSAPTQQPQPVVEPPKVSPEPNFDQLLDILLNLEAPLEARVGACKWLSLHSEKFSGYLQSNTDKDMLIAMLRLLSTTAAQIAGSM